jgi:iron complex transport system substrate-binding protein
MSQARGIARLAGAALLLLLPLAPPHAGTAQPRFASLNVCADQLLLMLADREEIASLSYHGANPNFSYYWERAQGLPVNRGQAEELLAAAPTLVLGGAYSNPATQHLLENLGTTVLPLDVPSDFAGIRAGASRPRTCPRRGAGPQAGRAGGWPAGTQAARGGLSGERNHGRPRHAG